MSLHRSLLQARINGGYWPEMEMLINIPVPTTPTLGWKQPFGKLTLGRGTSSALWRTQYWHPPAQLLALLCYCCTSHLPATPHLPTQPTLRCPGPLEGLASESCMAQAGHQRTLLAVRNFIASSWRRHGHRRMRVRMSLAVTVLNAPSFQGSERGLQVEWQGTFLAV